MGIECIYDKKKLGSLTWLSRHLSKEYDETLLFYINKNNLGNCEICAFCLKNIAKPKKIKYTNNRFVLDYGSGYSCNELKCKKEISLKYLKVEYDPKKFDKIGSRSDYIAHKRKIGINDAKKLKYDENAIAFKSNLNGFVKKYGEEEGKKRYDDRNEKIAYSNSINYYKEKYGENGEKKYEEYISRLNTSLNGFVKKYGEEEGKKRYDDRNEKIAYSNSVDFYIEKYGENGEKKYEEYIKKLSYRNTIDYFIERYGEELGSDEYDKKMKPFLNSKYNKQSKKSLYIGEMLDRHNILYEEEKNIKIINKNYFVDFYLPEYNLVIEFYGDYWHCNPKVYESTYYNKLCKMCANDIWDKDKVRINNIKKELKSSCLIIWESSKIDDILLLENIKNVINKKIIKYI